jgi:hypothetical protein
MPYKDRQHIDAKLLLKLRELNESWRAFERRLEEEERELWQPDWRHSDGLSERLSRVGYPREIIDELQKYLDLIHRLVCGGSLSPSVIRDVNQMDAAQSKVGESAVGQLAAIVIAAPNRVGQAKPPQWPRCGVEASRTSDRPDFSRFIRYVG